jgi:CPA2 family monovalent cation:H+ antiporter-2
MASVHEILVEVVGVYVLALGLLLLASKLRLPPIVAFLLTGAIAGPYGLGLIATQEDVEQLAEIGIVLLLFTVGLDFSVREVERLWRAALIGGTTQILGTAAVVAAVAYGTGASNARTGILIGVFVALSSTAIVLKELARKNELDAPHGRLAVAVLLLQDLCIVIFLLLVPILSGNTPVSALPGVLVRIVGAVAALVVAGRLILPLLFRLVTAAGGREAFSLAVLVASVGTALLSAQFGLSMAIGAFLAGLILAGSEFSHQAHAEIRPLRDLLASLFFISLGMLVNVRALLPHLPEVFALTAAILVVKGAIASGALIAAAAPLRVAVAGGVALSQVGEFSFVLGQSALESGLLSPDTWQILLAASIVTMLVTPSLVGVAAPLGARATQWLRGEKAGSDAADSDHIPDLQDHVIVFGFGVGGQLVARGLRDLHVPYVVLELNGATVARARAAGEPIFYGDATSRDTMEAAGAARARAVIAVLSDPDATRRLIGAARSVSPTVPIVVRTRYRGEATRMHELGATIAVAEELEGSLEVLTQLLSYLDIPDNIAEFLLDGFREQTGTMRPLRSVRHALGSLPDEIARMPVATYQLMPGDESRGRTLAEVNLRARTGAMIMAVRRASNYILSPPADLLLEAGDILYLLGDDADVALAQAYLQRGSLD